MRRLTLAIMFLCFWAVGSGPTRSADVPSLRRETSEWLQRASVFDGIERWQIGQTHAEFLRVADTDGTSTRCALTVRAIGYVADPALESVQIGFERFPATSRPDALDGTMFLRVRVADTAT